MPSFPQLSGVRGDSAVPPPVHRGYLAHVGLLDDLRVVLCREAGWRADAAGSAAIAGVVGDDAEDGGEQHEREQDEAEVRQV